MDLSLNGIARAVGQTLKDALGALPGGKPVADRIAAGARSIANGIAHPPPVTLAPAGASTEEEFAHYQRILEARGFTLHPPTALAIRGTDDVTMVVLQRDPQGEPHVITLAMSTLAGSATEEYQVRTLEPGEYLLFGVDRNQPGTEDLRTFDTQGRVPGTGVVNPESPAWGRQNTVDVPRAQKLIVLDADER